MDVYRSLASASSTCDAHPAYPSVARCTICKAHLCAHCTGFVGLGEACAACVQAQARWEKGRGARLRRLARYVASACAVVAACFVSHRRIDPHHYGAHRRTIERLAAVVDRDPCAVKETIALVGALRDAYDTPAAGGYLDRSVHVCHFPVEVDRLAYDVHTQLSENDAAVRDATRWITQSPDDPESYRARAASTSIDEASLRSVALDELTAYRFGPRHDAAIDRVIEALAMSGDPAAANRLEAWKQSMICRERCSTFVTASPFGSDFGRACCEEDDAPTVDISLAYLDMNELFLPPPTDD